MTPVFGLVALGYAAAKLRVLSPEGVRGVVLFVFNFAIPALLFRSLAVMVLPEDIDWSFLAAFYAGSFATYFLGMVFGRFSFGRGMADQAIFGLVGSNANLVMMGIPVVLSALGPEASLPMLLIIGFQSATFMPITIALIQRGLGSDQATPMSAGAIFLELARNPILVGIAAGFAVNALEMPLWVGIDRTVELLGAAAVPGALFAMGASLASYPMRGAAAPTATLATLKLVVHPVLVWFFAVPVLGAEGLWVSVAILLSAMPSAVNSYLFGARYGVSADLAARTVLLTTIASAVTITVALALLASGG